MKKNPYLLGQDMNQLSFAPPSIDDMIEPENPVRFIQAFVDQLHLSKLDFQKATPADTGAASYHPQALLKLYLYGYLNRIRSSRRLEKECIRNLEAIWLLEKLKPDHNTIARFRKDNRKALVNVYQIFVRMCVEMRLVKGQSVCIDGTPIKADNGLKQATNMELSKKKLEYAKKQLALVEQYLADLDAGDQIDQGKLNQAFAIDIDPNHLPNIQDIKDRIAKHEQDIATMEKTGQKQILHTDPDARVMPAKSNGLKACYNIQTATDTESHMVVGFDTTNDPNDMNKLLSTAEIAKENIQTESLGVIADKGYESAHDIEACLMNGVVPDVGFTRDREQRVFAVEYQEKDISEEQRCSTKPEDIQACLHAGVLPKCYEDTNISIEVQHQNAVSCFIRHEDGRVTCPMGKELFFQGHKKNGDVYGSKEACRTCPNRCTDGKRFKTVKFGPETHYVPVIMYGSSHQDLQQIPNIDQPLHYHAFGKVKRKPAQVMIFIKRDIAKQKLRMRVSEHPFGTVKHHDNAGYFLCRGKEMAAAEISLAYLSYNIRRAITLAGGVSRLVALFLSKITEFSTFYRRFEGKAEA